MTCVVDIPSAHSNAASLPLVQQYRHSTSQRSSSLLAVYKYLGVIVALRLRLALPDLAYRVWIMDLPTASLARSWSSPSGPAVPSDTGSDPPSLNAPPGSDYNLPRTPPAPPLSLAGGLTPNPASTSQARLAIAMLVSSACYLAARFRNCKYYQMKLR